MPNMKAVKHKIKGKLKQAEGDINQSRGKGVKGGMQKIQGKFEEFIADVEMGSDRGRHGDDLFEDDEGY